MAGSDMPCGNHRNTVDRVPGTSLDRRKETVWGDCLQSGPQACFSIGALINPLILIETADLIRFRPDCYALSYFRNACAASHCTPANQRNYVTHSRKRAHTMGSLGASLLPSLNPDWSSSPVSRRFSSTLAPCSHALSYWPILPSTTSAATGTGTCPSTTHVSSNDPPLFGSHSSPSNVQVFSKELPDFGFSSLPSQT